MPTELRLLTEVGIMAAGYRHPLTQRILGALHTLRPESSAPLLGLAMYHIECGRPAEAVALLQQAIASGGRPSGDMQAFLAVALIAMKRMSEAERLLNKLLSTIPEDGPVARMAMGMLSQHGLSSPSGARFNPPHSAANPTE
jgi:hypothetical protein